MIFARAALVISHRALRKGALNTIYATNIPFCQMSSLPEVTKRPFEHKSIPRKTKKAKRTKREKNIRAGGSVGDVLDADVFSLLHNLDDTSRTSLVATPEPWTEINVTIEILSSTGDGLGRTNEQSPYVILVPFTLPGDIVIAKVVTNVQETSPYVKADLVRIVQPSEQRDDSLVRCRYFGQCSGCQLQMLPYQDQLAHKRTVVEKAYRNFSRLGPRLIPAVEDTLGSPLQYGYRTKLTPHFDGPKQSRKLARIGEKAHFDEVPPIGFNQKQIPKTIDIEECPISTRAVQLGLSRERERVKRDLANYTKGATLLLRESTEKLRDAQIPSDIKVPGVDDERQTVYESDGQLVLAKTCITDHKAIFSEYVDDFRIQNSANSFFQNNNSILSTFVSYIRSQVFACGDVTAESKIVNLIDAYSGCGLFSITLCSLFRRTIGIDVDQAAIAQARSNVLANLHESTNPLNSGYEGGHITSVTTDPMVWSEPISNGYGKTEKIQDLFGSDQPSVYGKENDPDRFSSPKFIAADASQLFASVKGFRPEETVMILDPPRKGCDESFLAQLLEFGPERIIYVSCNVHTQAADVGMLVTGKTKATVQPTEELEPSDIDSKATAHSEEAVNSPTLYRLESLRPFDFFPQTSHVESVAVLSRIK